MKGKDSCSSAACCPVMTTVLGLVIIANTYFGWISWAYFIGILVTAYGLSLKFGKCPGKK